MLSIIIAVGAVFALGWQDDVLAAIRWSLANWYWLLAGFFASLVLLGVWISNLGSEEQGKKLAATMNGLDQELEDELPEDEGSAPQKAKRKTKKAKSTRSKPGARGRPLEELFSDSGSAAPAETASQQSDSPPEKRPFTSTIGRQSVIGPDGIIYAPGDTEED